MTNDFGLTSYFALLEQFSHFISSDMAFGIQIIN
jgi:hypothetical protein